jgi:cytochrome c2
MRRAVAILFAAGLALTGCGSKPAERAPSPDGDGSRGTELLAKFECNRCHEGTGLTEMSRDRHCVHCHQDIERRTFPADDATLTAWSRSIVHLREVPSLKTVGTRFRRDWLASFLREPHDLRPTLEESMPRLAMSEKDAADLATHLVPAESHSEAFLSADAELGQRVLSEKGCGTCHRFTGAPALAASALPRPIDDDQLRRGILLAPDLSHTRARFQSGALVSFLRDPESLAPGTAMPDPGLSEDEARAVARYVMTVPLAKTEPREVPAALPVLERPVRYDEVSARVFKKTCWHCHAEPGYALGDGGPGNTGGLGFPPRGIDLAQYEGVHAGYRDPTGHRRSLFEKRADGTPLLVAALIARQHEEAGRPVEGLRGMPLGLPALGAEEIQLVSSWIAQGRPR